MSLLIHCEREQKNQLELVRTWSDSTRSVCTPVTIKSTWTGLCCYARTLIKPSTFTTATVTDAHSFIHFHNRLSRPSNGSLCIGLQTITQTHFKAQTITHVSKLLTQLIWKRRAFGSSCFMGLQRSYGNVLTSKYAYCRRLPLCSLSLSLSVRTVN